MVIYVPTCDASWPKLFLRFLLLLFGSSLAFPLQARFHDQVPVTMAQLPPQQSKTRSTNAHRLFSYCTFYFSMSACRLYLGFVSVSLFDCFPLSLLATLAPTLAMALVLLATPSSPFLVPLCHSVCYLCHCPPSASRMALQMSSPSPSLFFGLRRSRIFLFPVAAPISFTQHFSVQLKLFIGAARLSLFVLVIHVHFTTITFSLCSARLLFHDFSWLKPHLHIWPISLSPSACPASTYPNPARRLRTLKVG